MKRNTFESYQQINKANTQASKRTHFETTQIVQLQHTLKRKYIPEAKHQAKRNQDPLDYLLNIYNLYLGDKVDHYLKKITNEWLKPRAQQGFILFNLAVAHQNHKVIQHLLKLPCIKQQIETHADLNWLISILSLKNYKTTKQICDIPKINHMIDDNKEYIAEAASIYADEDSINLIFNKVHFKLLRVRAQQIILDNLIKTGQTGVIKTHIDSFKVRLMKHNRFKPHAIAIEYNLMETAVLFIDKGFSVNELSLESRQKYQNWHNIKIIDELTFKMDKLGKSLKDRQAPTAGLGLKYIISPIGTYRHILPEQDENNEDEKSLMTLRSAKKYSRNSV